MLRKMRTVGVSGFLFLVCLLLALPGCGNQEADPPQPNEEQVTQPPPQSNEEQITQPPPSPPKPETTTIVDSALSLEEALAGLDFPAALRQDLDLVTVHYLGFDGRRHTGQLVIHKDLRVDAQEIFREIEEAGFPLESVKPVSQFGWSDEQSMANNNTSGFNYRRIEGRAKMSLHAEGRAIDINPRLNPYVGRTIVQPAGATYDPAQTGTVKEDGPVVQAFLKRGWKWGGHWKKAKDWQHFEKGREG